MMMWTVLAISAMADDGYQNLGDCNDDAYVEVEAEKWLATEIELDSDIDAIDRVFYEVVQGTQDDGTECDASLPHEVSLYVMGDDESEWVVAESHAFEVDVDEDGAHRIYATLDQALTLESGDRVFLAVRFDADAADNTAFCMGAGDDCTDDSAHGSVHYNVDLEDTVIDDLKVNVGAVGNAGGILVWQVCGDGRVTGNEVCDYNAPKSDWHGLCDVCSQSKCECLLYNPKWDPNWQPPVITEPEIIPYDPIDPNPFAY